MEDIYTRNSSLVWHLILKKKRFVGGQGAYISDWFIWRSTTVGNLWLVKQRLYIWREPLITQRPWVNRLDDVFFQVLGRSPPPWQGESSQEQDLSTTYSQSQAQPWKQPRSVHLSKEANHKEWGAAGTSSQFTSSAFSTVQYHKYLILSQQEACSRMCITENKEGVYITFMLLAAD